MLSRNWLQLPIPNFSSNFSMTEQPARTKIKNRYPGIRVVLIAGVTALSGSILLAVALGSVSISPWTILRSIGAVFGLPTAGLDPAEQAVILLIRLPRVAAAILAGAGLAVAGTVMQGIFRNPLAEPGILGVSAGSSLGALIAIASGATAFFLLPAFAFAGAMIAVGVILGIAFFNGGRIKTASLVMSGMAISSFFAALTSLTLTLSNQYQVSSFIFWTMGGLANRRWEHVLAVLPPVVMTILVIYFKARDLDILLLGDEEARALGVSPQSTRFLMVLLASICTASVVSITGPIGFVGLIIPHIMRLLVGPAHRTLAIASIFGGAIFLVLCDLVTRLIAWPAGVEISVGIVTALIGAPYFLFLMFRSARKGGELS
jgi:iron complex transport system permease protein